MIKQRNYLSKAKKYSYRIFLLSLTGSISLLFIAIILIRRLYLKEIHEETKLKRIGKTWLNRLQKSKTIILNLILIKIKDLYDFINKLDENLDRLFGIKKKLKIILIICVDYQQCHNEISEYAKENGYILINISKISDLVILNTINYISYFLITLTYSYMSSYKTQFNYTKSEKISRLTMNNVILNHIQYGFLHKNYGFSAVFSIEKDRILIGNEILDGDDGDCEKYYNEYIKWIVKSGKGKVIYKKWSLLRKIDLSLSKTMKMMSNAKVIFSKKKEIENSIIDDEKEEVNNSNDDKENNVSVEMEMYEELSRNIYFIIDKYMKDE